MSRIVVGMSGGVDSAVAATLLKEAGHEVVGVTLRTWDREENRDRAIGYAEATADLLGIDYHVVDCAADFALKVERPFVEAYLQGLTPNPCVFCNHAVKWEGLLRAAAAYGADYLATGHYANLVRLPNGRLTVRKSPDAGKDQTYMLYRLSQEQLARTLFPLGGLTKEQVRQRAASLHLPSASLPDSQDICFVNQSTYADFIAARLPAAFPREGAFVGTDGRVLGRHRGIFHYTVGQRRGLGVACGRPMFVKCIRPASNEVVLAEQSELELTQINCRDCNWLSIPGLGADEHMRALVKIRYHHKGVEAGLSGLPGHRVRLTFAGPLQSPSPGQSAVFYDEDGCVIGGGVFEADQ